MTDYRPRKPEGPPSEADLAEREAFNALVHESLTSVRSSAETWRNGLTAFITLVTTGIVIKGRESTSLLEVGWRVAVTAFLGVGLACAVLGLWQTLAAQAGTRAGTVHLTEVLRDYGSVAAYSVALAAAAARRMRRARILVGVALSFLLSGIVANWWAPTAPAVPPAYLQVTSDQTTACGVLQSADGGEIVLKVDGAAVPVIIPVKGIANLKVVSRCG
ncbi:hypothetical protein AB0M80_17000 [Amycolatopsis sp. NPDC051045]|uniref:hypothetical protein n=1 Tax=Amycolatopsis sp. NPDC051045 TaxID=3156922 RepID=UPI003444224C